MKYIVWTGTKFKGSWDDKDLALRYMASHDPESKAWTLTSVDLDKNLNSEVPAMIAKMKEESAKPAAGAKVHNLKAKSVEATAKGKVG